MRVLFVCTGNSCRSVLAAACLQARQPTWQVASGGIRPEAETSARTLAELRSCAWALPAEAPKRWEGAGNDIGIGTGTGAVNWDAIIVLSPEALAVLERAVPNAPVLAWTMPDPMAVKGTDSERSAAYRRARQVLEARLADWLEAGMPGLGRQEA